MTGKADARSATPLLLLHGALGAGAQLAGLATALGEDRTVIAPDFSGHGIAAARRDDTAFGITRFASDVVALLDTHGVDRADVFGYSMGGYVGLYIARHHPGRIGSVMTLGTKFAWDSATAAKEAARLDPDKMQAKVPAFAARLKELHGDGWARVVRATSEMMLALGSTPMLTHDDLGAISNRCLISVGDRDAIVTAEETLRAARALTAGECLILPATPHPLEQVAHEPLLFHLRRFFNRQTQTAST